jgi:type IV pilus assembly protein PilO
MSLKNLPWWGQLLVVAVICAVVVVTQYTMAPLNLNEKQKQIERQEDDLEKLRAKILRGKQAQAKLDELQRSIASLERKLADLRQILPTQPELGDLLKRIKGFADQTNLELEIFKPEALAELEFLREQPIRMEVIGNYHQLGLFFDRVSKFQRIVNVENVAVKPAPKNQDRSVRATIQANFVAKTFIYRDEQDEGEGE